MSSSPQTSRPVAVPQPSSNVAEVAAPKKAGRAPSPFVLVPDLDDADLEPQWTAAIDSATD